MVSATQGKDRRNTKRQRNKLKRLAEKKKYVVDLERLQGICSRNYGLFLRLLPLHYQLMQSWVFDVSSKLSFELRVIEISRYTEAFVLKQIDEHLPTSLKTQIEFRLYHDAQMLEVIGYQQHSNLRANNPYPNPRLHHKDEKFQVNSLLKDWLNLVVNQHNQTSGLTLLTSPLI